jgi:transposase
MTTYIGIDLHKKTQTWVGLSGDSREKLFTEEYPVTPEGVRTGCTFARSLGTPLKVAIEPVCGWRWVVPMLKSFDMEVQISNPRKVKAIADSLQKNDVNDAHTLALLCRTDMMHTSRQLPQEMETVRSLVRERFFLVSTMSGMKCRLEGVITRDGRHRITGALYTKKGRDAIAASTESEWIRSLAVIDDMQKHIDILDEKIATYATNSVPKRLVSIPGIGPVTAVSLWAEIGDYTHFDAPEKLCAFAGLVPTERSSGGTQKLGRITKAGSPLLRYMLVEAAMRIRNNEKSASLYDFYARMKLKKKPMVARVALARKILTISWYLVTRGENYNPIQPKKQNISTI